MGKSIFRWVCLIALLTAACSQAPAPEGHGKVIQSQIRRDLAPEVENGDLVALVEGNTEFALDMYRRIGGVDDNLFFSPFSLSTALAMVYAGARGITESQMAEVLRYSLPPERLHPAFNWLDAQLRSNGSNSAQDNSQPFQLSVANAIWGQEGFEFVPGFLDTLARNYGAGLRLIDFQADAESARLKINEWVAENTRDRIKDIIPPGGLSAAVRLVLANAIYFKADWQTRFEPANTRSLPFTLLDGTQVATDFMSHAKTETLAYASGDGFQAVELPYRGGEMSMLVLLPDDGRFIDFEAGLSRDRLDEITAEMQPQPVRVILPKFKFESAFQAAEILAEMGMPDAFCGGEVDFSGMDGRGELCIGQIYHKAFVAADEKGTEAAAASVVVMEAAGLPLNEVVVFHANRPFIFIIRHKITGSVLFIGRLKTPQAP